MRKLICAGVLVIAAAAPAEAGAQGSLPIAVEVRIDAGLPVGDAADVYENGVGFGIDGFVHVTPSFALYGGYSQFEFDVEGLGDVDAKLDGPEVGGRVTLGTGGGVWNPFFQFGALLVEDETGFEAGLGGFYPVGQNLSVTPMARYRSIDDFEFVTLGVGVNIRL